MGDQFTAKLFIEDTEGCWIEKGLGTVTTEKCEVRNNFLIFLQIEKTIKIKLKNYEYEDIYSVTISNENQMKLNDSKNMLTVANPILIFENKETNHDSAFSFNSDSYFSRI